MPARLVRFRADPKKVRVSIVRVGDIWRATVHGRGKRQGYVGEHRRPVQATVLALQVADQVGLDGVDLSMGWSYSHPFIVEDDPEILETLRRSGR